MISLSQPRRVAAEDYYQISNLILHDSNIHRHLDWRSPLEWVGDPNYWAVEEYGRLTAAFACPADPPQVAWIRLFAYQPHQPAQELWSAIWETARSELAPQTHVAAIVTRQWFHRLLLSSNFTQRDTVVLLDVTLSHPPAQAQPPSDFRIRPMLTQDLPVVAEVDAAAFGWFWRNSIDSLQRAYAHAVHATVAEDETGVVGYQISTGTTSGVHLARLAVMPGQQGRGVGSALIRELFWRTGARKYSVNTQQGNVAALALYKKMGFCRSGESFPVLVYTT